MLTTTRRAEAEGLGEKAEIELSDTTRAKQGLGKAADEIEAIRASWGEQVNRALERARVVERVDHRSFARQGRDRVATQHAGPAVSGMERKAERERVQAQARQERAREGMEAAAAAEAPALAPLVPERPQEGQERPQEAARAVPVPVEASGPVQVHQAAQDGLERPRAAQERAAALRPVESPPRPARTELCGPLRGCTGRVWRR